MWLCSPSCVVAAGEFSRSHLRMSCQCSCAGSHAATAGHVYSRGIALAGPSGVGKSTIIHALMAKYPDKFGFSLSATTRQPRPGEVNGRDYQFLNRERFQELIAQGEFVEHADVHGNFYGTTKSAVDNVTSIGKIWLKDIDCCGCQQLKKHPTFHPIFIMVVAPDEAELERRLRGRGTETEEVVQRRLRDAIEEMKQKDSGLFDRVVVNGTVEQCLRDLEAVLREAHLLD
ncbi:putative Guanylate kinase [Paratrimastix pyriformis]|uniref:guanylate kinase n=1 Tax=Paratrimastix pyriformis TaxID=342808 RepID=A0ABQ8USY2_9EUKA|nr:putative Guanylate kinase [Paratrimastix pyriformis]